MSITIDTKVLSADLASAMHKRAFQELRLKRILERILEDPKLIGKVELIGDTKNPVYRFTKKGNRQKLLIVKEFSTEKEAQTNFDMMKFDYEAMSNPTIVAEPLHVVSAVQKFYLVMEKITGRTLQIYDEKDAQELVDTLLLYQHDRTAHAQDKKAWRQRTRMQIYAEAEERIALAGIEFDYLTFRQRIKSLLLGNDESCLVHGDVKPDNILKRSEGGYVIIDNERSEWGCAHADFSHLELMLPDLDKRPEIRDIIVSAGTAHDQEKHIQRTLKAWQLTGRAMKYHELTQNMSGKFNCRKTAKKYLSAMAESAYVVGQSRNDKKLILAANQLKNLADSMIPSEYRSLVANLRRKSIEKKGNLS